jgi:hypothetical protein
MRTARKCARPMWEKPERRDQQTSGQGNLDNKTTCLGPENSTHLLSNFGR